MTTTSWRASRKTAVPINSQRAGTPTPPPPPPPPTTTTTTTTTNGSHRERFGLPIPKQERNTLFRNVGSILPVETS
jgi:hypothetical protein